MTHEYVHLVAFVVVGDSDAETADYLCGVLPPTMGRDSDSLVDSWWLAADDRPNGDQCDMDSAVFVKFGHQEQAREALEAQGLAWPSRHTPEPDGDVLVLDRDGEVWRRIPGGWQCDGDVHTWDSLDSQRAPLTIYRNGDPE